LADKLRECPNCGAYVLSEDRYCPRCDYLLDEVPPPLTDDESAPEAAIAPPEPSTVEPVGEGPVEIVKEVDVPTTRLPWARPVFSPAPAEPDDAGEAEPPGATRAHTAPEEPVEDAPEGDLADLPAPELPDATRAHTAPEEPVEAVPEGDLVDLPAPELPDATRATLPPLPPDVPDDLPEVFAAGEAADEAQLGGPAAPEPVSDGEATSREAEPAPPDQDADTSALETGEPAGPEVDLAAEKTMPRLTEDLVGPADEIHEADLDDSEMPTTQFRQRLEEPEVPDEPTVVRQQQDAAPPVGVPPAPYTPPPAMIAPPPAPAYAIDPGVAYLQQRVQAYVYGGYRLHVHAPHEATLSQGKQLGVGGWLLALVSVIGFLWYLLILMLSGFKPDMAYLVLEADGRVYEDGPGAAHIRHQRSRTGRRWSIFGLVILFLGLGLSVVLIAVAGIVLTQERYQAALREAYPAVTLFEERFSDAQADPDDVKLAETGAVVYAILAVVAVLGVWGGATLFVIGTVHAGAYRVAVPPLPGYA